MKKYKVKIVSLVTSEIDVEADSKEDAEKFVNSDEKQHELYPIHTNVDIKDIVAVEVNQCKKEVNTFDKELIDKKVGDSVNFVVINLKKRKLENSFSGFEISKIDNMEITATYPFSQWIDDIKYDLSDYGKIIIENSNNPILEDMYVRFAVSSLDFYYENENKYLELIS